MSLSTLQPSSSVSGYAHRGRSLPMDMLRGVAILLVLGRHYVVQPENLGWLQPFAAGWMTIGWAGVDLFFVLSGYLVSGLIFAEYRQRGAVDIRRFVIRRGFKIWPPYLGYIAIVALWIAWQHQQGRGPVPWSELWPNVFHVQNYFHTPRVHTWSLAVEEHFYLVAAFVFWWVLRRGPGSRLRQLPWIVAICVLGLAALRHTGFLRNGAAELNLYATHLRFDGLLIGTLIAYWTHFEPAKIAPLTRRPLRVMLVGVMLVAPTLAMSPEASPWHAGIGLTSVYVGFALLMLGWLNVANVHLGWRAAFMSWPAALLGQIGFFSYSIYLWHVDLAQTPVRKVVAYSAGMNLSPVVTWSLATVIYVALAVGAGMALARLLEIPSLALRDRMFPSAVKPLAIGRAQPAEERKITGAESGSAVTRVGAM